MSKKYKALTEEEIKEYKSLQHKYVVEGKELTSGEKKLFKKYNTQSIKDRIHDLRKDLETAKTKDDKKELQNIKKKIQNTKRELFDISHPMLSTVVECITETGKLFGKLNDTIEISEEIQNLMILTDD